MKQIFLNILNTQNKQFTCILLSSWAAADYTVPESERRGTNQTNIFYLERLNPKRAAQAASFQRSSENIYRKLM